MSILSSDSLPSCAVQQPGLANLPINGHAFMHGFCENIRTKYQMPPRDCSAAPYELQFARKNIVRATAHKDFSVDDLREVGILFPKS